jgi:hypothetical protein
MVSPLSPTSASQMGGNFQPWHFPTRMQPWWVAQMRIILQDHLNACKTVISSISSFHSIKANNMFLSSQRKICLHVSGTIRNLSALWWKDIWWCSVCNNVPWFTKHWTCQISAIKEHLSKSFDPERFGFLHTIARADHAQFKPSLPLEVKSSSGWVSARRFSSRLLIVS